MSVLPGPGFGGPSIVQLAEETSSWWLRDEHGILWIRVVGDPRWHDAPVPMVEISEEELVELEGARVEPSRISTALDLRALDGPEVDEALGVANALDTTVDAWEAGEEVPSLEEVRRLAFLTGQTVRWFFGPPVATLRGVFICRR